MTTTGLNHREVIQIPTDRHNQITTDTNGYPDTNIQGVEL